jgi:hypothetical protein
LAFDVVAASTNRSIIITPYLILVRTGLLVDFIAQSQRVLGSEIIFLNALVLALQVCLIIRGGAALLGLIISAVSIHVESVAQADALELILVVIFVALSH